MCIRDSLYSDVPEFRQRLHREVIDETYPKLHELLRPLSQEDLDRALCVWSGNIESKHAVVRYMKDHAREKDTAAWLAQEYGGSNSPFVVRAGKMCIRDRSCPCGHSGTRKGRCEQSGSPCEEDCKSDAPPGVL